MIEFIEETVTTGPCSSDKKRVLILSGHYLVKGGNKEWAKYKNNNNY